ncbi:TetR family transcriptional regulator [Pseudomonas sp. A46]|nr:TetR/AcrR family transcriptional regulator [Pseudomonas sp. A46]OWJ89999.1 TetR family transcriptional regulator [Pseudomonas sp. A46]
MARIGADLRRQDFVKAAINVIAEHGVANATTRRIAAAANAPLASLHYVFHTKDDLFYAVYESLFNLPQQALELVEAGSTPAETVTRMLRQTIDWFIENPAMARAQSELFLWTMRNNPEMTNRIYSVGISVTENSMSLAIGKNIDKTTVNDISRLVVQLFDGLILSWFAHGDPERLEEETETACRALSLFVSSIEDKTAL